MYYNQKTIYGIDGGNNMNLIVQKFGGTSVANVERIQHVAQIITDTYDKGNAVVAVVSAQGDTTDDLIAKAAEITDKPSSREMDVLLSTGEQISMSLLAMAIEKMGYPVIWLTGRQAGCLPEANHRNARIKKIKTVDSEEWSLIGDFIVRIKSEVEKIVSTNHRILEYYESPNFAKIKETCETLMSSQREFNEYINEKVQSISHLFGTRVVRNETINDDTYNYID